jgi:DNA-binding PadR family transcriptional regulator
VTLGPGALYGAITRLEERGLIEPLGGEDRRKPYRITAAGSTALAAAVADMRRIADVGVTRLGLIAGLA